MALSPTDVAGRAVDALKGSPIMLALVVLQCATLGVVVYSSTERQKAVSMQIQSMHELIDKCLSGLQQPRPP